MREIKNKDKALISLFIAFIITGLLYLITEKEDHISNVLTMPFFISSIYYFFKKDSNFKDKLTKEKSAFSSMSISELDKRAYAELKSEHYIVSLGFLNELIDLRGRELFRFYNMRAECYLNLNDNQSAMLDALRSVELEADINKNEKGYEIRNMLLKQGS